MALDNKPDHNPPQDAPPSVFFGPDSHARFMELAGNKAADGIVAGVAGAGLGQLNEEEIQRQRRRDEAAFSAAMDAAARANAAALKAIDEVFERNRPVILAAVNTYKADIAAGVDPATAQGRLTDSLAPTVEEAYDAAEEARPGQHEQNADAAIAGLEADPEFQSLPEDVQAQTTADLRARLESRNTEYNQKIGNNSLTAASWISSIGLGISPGGEAQPALQDKAQIAALIADQRTAAAAELQAQRDGLASIEADIAALRIAAENNRLALESSENLDQAQANAQAYNDSIAELDDLTAQLEEQRTTLNLQEEVNTLTDQYVDTLMEGLNDDLSNMDVDFIKRAIIMAPAELMQKSQELLERTGNTGNDPISLLKAMAEDPNSNLSTEDRQEITTFVTEIGEAYEALNTANEAKTQIEAEQAELAAYQARLDEMRANYESESYLMVPVGPGNTISPTVPTGDDPQALGQSIYAVEQLMREKEEEIARLQEQADQAQARLDDLLGVCKIMDPDAITGLTVDDLLTEISPATDSATESELPAAPAPAPQPEMSLQEKVLMAFLADRVDAREVETMIRDLGGTEMSDARVMEIKSEVLAEMEASGQIIDARYADPVTGIVSGKPPLGQGLAENDPAKGTLSATFGGGAVQPAPAAEPTPAPDMALANNTRTMQAGVPV